ncbi:helix-turn-helix domain-containing protein [Nocardiopsis sp. CNT-189]|uniref:GbsR/MarR family transcriptional regulator n=1 Tax=Nocardiopsis oceanisediminis TaxID=2816862 RepID=UPI003B32C263
MPGGRLTRQERARIAAGLADGLTYAEIARELGRPTSTVSREVARNGGPRGYRAERAERDTRRRARRSGPNRSAAPAAAGRERAPEAVRRFEEQFTELLVGTGLPRMASRVLTCLYTSDGGSLTAAELVERLRVSPASVSGAVGLLEGQGLIRRERDGRRRADRYVVGGDTWYRSVLASARTNAALAEGARRGVEVFGAGSPAGGRMEAMNRLFLLLNEDMLDKADQWLRSTAERGEADPPG